jgi:hypothetical protein
MADTAGKKSGFELIIGARDKFSNTFKAFNGQVDRMRGKLTRMKVNFHSFSRASGLDRVGKAFVGVFSGAKASVKDFNSLLGGVMGLVSKLTVVMGGAAGGIFALARNTANAGDAAMKSAARAGVGVEIWQEYAHAASLADLSQEQLIKGFGGLQDAAVKAARGDKAKSGVFKLLGIDPKTAQGEIKNADSLFLELADKIKALRESGQEAKAVNLLGDVMGDREARAFIPLLASGKAGLLDMRQEAHKLGLVFSQEDGAAAEGFSDALTRGGAALKGLGHTFGKVLLPPLTKLIDKFSAWVTAQREVMGADFAEWVKGWNIDAIWNAFQSILDFLVSLGPRIKSITEAVGGAKNAFLILGAAILHKLVFALGKLMFSLGGVIIRLGSVLLPALASASIGFIKFGIALMATPVGWIMAGIAAIAGAAYLIYKNWAPVSAFFADLWQGVRKAFSLAGEAIMEKWDNIRGWFKETFQALTSWLPDWVKEKMGLKVDLYADAPSGFSQAEPLNMAPAARSLTQSRSESVERNEVVIKVRSENGAEAKVSGSGGQGVSWQVGELAWGY